MGVICCNNKLNKDKNSKEIEIQIPNVKKLSNYKSNFCPCTIKGPKELLETISLSLYIEENNNYKRQQSINNSKQQNTIFCNCGKNALNNTKNNQIFDNYTNLNNFSFSKFNSRNNNSKLNNNISDNNNYISVTKIQKHSNFSTLKSNYYNDITSYNMYLIIKVQSYLRGIFFRRRFLMFIEILNKNGCNILLKYRFKYFCNDYSYKNPIINIKSEDMLKSYSYNNNYYNINEKANKDNIQDKEEANGTIHVANLLNFKKDAKKNFLCISPKSLNITEKSDVLTMSPEKPKKISCESNIFSNNNKNIIDLQKSNAINNTNLAYIKRASKGKIPLYVNSDLSNYTLLDNDNNFNNDKEFKKDNYSLKYNITKQGFRSLVWPDNSIFIGNFVNNIAEGLGKQIHSNGEIYFGTWKRGKAEGIGYYINKFGSKYEGEWKNDYQNGFGLEIWNDNTDKKNFNNFSGNYKFGLKSGIGILNFEDGSVYEGDFSENNINGIGSIIFNCNNNLITKKYSGEWKNNNIEGFGIMTWSDGKQYEGSFVKNCKHGFGVYHCNNKIYVGYWKNNKLEGEVCIVYLLPKEYKNERKQYTTKNSKWENGKRVMFLNYESKFNCIIEELF